MKGKYSTELDPHKNSKLQLIKVSILKSHTPILGKVFIIETFAKSSRIGHILGYNSVVELASIRGALCPTSSVLFCFVKVQFSNILIE